jgi:hypothetical protein
VEPCLFTLIAEMYFLFFDPDGLYYKIILTEEATDGASMESSVCAGCLNILDEEEFIQALNQEWHMECFRYLSLNYYLFISCNFHHILLIPVNTLSLYIFLSGQLQHIIVLM